VRRRVDTASQQIQCEFTLRRCRRALLNVGSGSWDDGDWDQGFLDLWICGTEQGRGSG
jgi:hypothetical protein